MKRTTIWLDDIDRAHLAQIQEHYRLSTLSDAMRFAAQHLAQEIERGSSRVRPPKQRPSDSER